MSKHRIDHFSDKHYAIGVERIWQYCRDNCNSLDSERATGVIQSEVDNITETMKRCINGMEADIKMKKKEIRNLKAKVQASHLEVVNLTAMCTLLSTEADDLRGLLEPKDAVVIRKEPHESNPTDHV